jgi:hypothetical protein
MRPLALLFTLALGVSAFATNAPDWLVGTYRLELSSEVKSTAQKLGMAEPYARIMLRQDGTFSYASNSGGNVTGTSGTFELNDRTIRLIAANEFPAQHVKTLTGKADPNSLEIDGLKYVKAGSNFDVVGTWNVRGSNGSLNKSIKMVFKSNHTFEFAGMAATSRGRFELEGDRLILIWTEVDGEPAEDGMRKTLYLHEDGTFNIDTYVHVKN